MKCQNGAFSEVFEHAVDTFAGSMKAGLQFQEELARLFTGKWAPGTEAVQDWQRRTQSAWSEMIPVAQKNADEYLKLFDANYRTGLELARKFADTGRAETPRDAQQRLHELVDESLEAIRNSGKAAAEANMRAMQAWAEVIRNGVQQASAAAASAVEQVRNAAEKAKETSPAAAAA
jgi:hypothetical protein